MINLLETNAEWILASGTTQDISNCIGACAKLEIPCPNMVGLLEANAEWMYENGTTQAIANSIWACGTFGIQCPNMIRLLETNAEWMFESGTTQEITNCLWACGRLGIPCPKIIGLLEANAEWIIENGKTQEVATSVWACGTLGIRCPKLFQLVEENAQRMFADGDVRHISMFALGLSLAGSPSTLFFDAVFNVSPECWSDAEALSLCNLCYACTVTDVFLWNQYGRLAQLWSMLLENENALSSETFGAIQYIELYTATFGIEIAAPSLNIRRKIDSEVQFITLPSRFQDEVSGVCLIHNLRCRRS